MVKTSRRRRPRTLPLYIHDGKTLKPTRRRVALPDIASLPVVRLKTAAEVKEDIEHAHDRAEARKLKSREHSSKKKKARPR